MQYKIGAEQVEKTELFEERKKIIYDLMCDSKYKPLKYKEIVYLLQVPEEDAKRVMKALNGTEYKGRTVRCNDADEEGHGRAARGGRDSESRGGRSSERGGRSSEGRGRRGSSDDARDSRDSRGKGGRGSRGESRGGRKSRSQEDTGDWRQFFQNNDNVKFKGEEPNFEEEGWARRRPKKK